MRKINSLQFTSMIIMTILTAYLGIGILAAIKADARNSWLIVILASVLGIGILLLFLYINSFKETLPINDKIKLLFGKKLGFIINAILALIVITYGISLSYNLNNFIVSQFLTQTPLFIIGLLFSIIIIYINIKGIETISRVSLILIFINFILYALATLDLFPKIDYSNFKPILENGISNVFKGSINILLLNLTPLLILLIVPKDSIVDKQHLKKYVIIGYIISITLTALIMLMIIGNLGPNLASLYQYPEYIVLKRINLLNFLDRIENIIVLQWIFGIFQTSSIAVFYISKTIKKKDSKLVPILVTSLIFLLSLNLFKNNTVFEYYTLNIIPIIRLIFLIIFIIIGIRIFLYNHNHNNT